MLDLKKLNDMLDSVLASETAESLNHWIDEQIEKDRSQGIIRDSEFRFLDRYDKSSKSLPHDRAVIDIGISENIKYNNIGWTQGA